MRHLCASVVVIILGLGVCRPWLSWGQTATPFSRVAGQTTVVGLGGVQRFFYMGAESCAASTCHGSTTSRHAPRTGILQTEYTQWLTRDKHAKAYEALRQPRSLQIASTLRMPEAPSQSARCLVCHTLHVPKELRSATYKLEDGVSCEACHGQAEGWLGIHIGHGHEAAVSTGMYETRNLVKRAEKCVACHVGDETRQVDHELMAAGHPDLVFELETYTAMLPPHWRPASADGTGGRAWAVGQVVALRESLKRLARRVQQRGAPSWPEFAELECFACHHEVNNIASSAYRRDAEDRLQAGPRWAMSWRQQRGYAGVAGLPPWNPARYSVLRHLLQAIAPENHAALDQEVQGLRTLMAQVGASSPTQVAAAATRVAQMADALLPRVTALAVSADLASTVVRSITSDSVGILGAGPRVAEQATMALETFVRVARRRGKPLTQEPIVADALQRLVRVREQSTVYDREQVEQGALQMQAIYDLLTRQ